MLGIELELVRRETHVERRQYGSSRVDNAPFMGARFRHVGRWVISMVKVISEIVDLGRRCLKDVYESYL